MIIELKQSANGDNPDQQGGQHTNVSTLWVRLDEGPGRRCNGSRSLVKAKREIEKALEVEQL